MSMSDPVADLFTRIRNALQARLLEITCRPSMLSKQILELLLREGYIAGFSELIECKSGNSQKNALMNIRLKYENGSPCIKSIEKISMPGRRVYTKIDGLKKPYNGLGIFILSTSKGILSDQEAKTLKVGGELIGRVL